MLYFETDPDSCITEYTLVHEDYEDVLVVLFRKASIERVSGRDPPGDLCSHASVC